MTVRLNMADVSTPNLAPLLSVDAILCKGRGLPNDDLFAEMIVSQAKGGGALPYGLGLSQATYTRLCARYFPELLAQIEDFRNPDDFEQFPERADLIRLLTAECAGRDPSERWIVEILTTACKGGDHLWQDLGLANRGQLTRLMNDNFPSLAAANDRDMKWKKFLYKQLCEREGIYVCRAPSCAECSDYDDCFGAED